MLLGSVTLELTGADVTDVLGWLSDCGVTLWDLEPIQGLSEVFTVSKQDYPVVRRLCEAKGCTLKVIRSAGMGKRLRRISKRPVLLAGILFLSFLTFFLPSRVLFIEVEGVRTMPAELIVTQAESCGIFFGASRKEIRSEVVKNRLLEAIPQLQWVGVNTYGCRAVISVRERSMGQTEPQQKGISSLVAVRDGVIREMTVLRGNPLCRVGQSVQQGQVLISGYTDLGICLRGTVAQGEVYGDTRRFLEVVTPANSLKRTGVQRMKKNFSIIFGKFRINFYKGSGISGGSCGKIYSYKYMTLPGGLRLPVVLVEEQSFWYTTETVLQDGEAAAQDLSKCAEDYLRRQMVAGRIDSRYEVFTLSEGVYHQVGQYACYEMLGRLRPEEDFTANEID